MNKTELIEKITKEVGISKSNANKSLTAIIDSITATLKKGKTVTLVGFGTFRVSKRKARKGRNPRTGAEIKIAAAKVPKFTGRKDTERRCE